MTRRAEGARTKSPRKRARRRCRARCFIYRRLQIGLPEVRTSSCLLRSNLILGEVPAVRLRKCNPPTLDRYGQCSADRCLVESISTSADHFHFARLPNRYIRTLQRVVLCHPTEHADGTAILFLKRLGARRVRFCGARAMLIKSHRGECRLFSRLDGARWPRWMRRLKLAQPRRACC